MTMSEPIMRQLEARGLDVELASRLGFGSVNRAGGECLVIPFKRDGETVRRKYRRFDREEGRWTQDPGGVRCAWNEDALRDQRLDGRPLIITEGELDAFAAIQCGYERTISVPDGAPPPGERSKDDLEQGRKYAWVQDLRPLLHKDHVPEIILAVDGDENGAALLQDLSVMLGRFRCKFLAYPKARDPERRGRARLKDLNEVLEDYGQKGVVETISRAQWLKVDGVYRMSELPPIAPAPVYDIGFQLYGENFKLRLGDFSVWTGIPSHGKSTFLNDALCRVVEAHGLTVAWASFEQRPQTDHRRNLRSWYLRAKPGQLDWTQAGIDEADAWIDRHHVFMHPNEDEDVTLDWFLEKAEVAVVRHGAQVIVGDPWNEMDHEYDMRAMTEAQYTNKAIKEIRRFARAFRVHVAIVAHPTKLQKAQDGRYPIPTLYDINGGAVWHNKADLGVVVHREDEDNTRIKTAKSRYHDIIGKPGSVLMQFCGDDRRYRETERGGA